MKIIGIEAVDGGVALVLPSGQRKLIALGPKGAESLGKRVLEMLNDPSVPEAQVDPTQARPRPKATKQKRKSSGNPFVVRPGETADEMITRAKMHTLAGAWRMLQRISE